MDRPVPTEESTLVLFLSMSTALYPKMKVWGNADVARHMAVQPKDHPGDAGNGNDSYERVERRLTACASSTAISLSMRMTSRITMPA